MRHFYIILLALPIVSAINDWQPVLSPDLYGGAKPSYGGNQPSFSTLVAQSYQQPSLQQKDGQCELYKVGFTQDLYFQYIQYKFGVPQMKEFTLCFWSKFTNHSNDHPIFSYAVENQPRAIYSWVSNTERSSYFSMAVAGQTFYRLNYPLRLNRWYHTCQSWNGRTGEWQIWVNAERVGRGFHNRLVGHGIPAGGVAITGQEQTQIGGGFLEGNEAPKGAGGMLGEVTMVQLYNVALTAGKAHKDHKHHHSAMFDHNGTPITTTPRPPSPPRPTLPTHPLLTAGQLNPQNALLIASGGQLQPAQQQQQPQIVQGQNFNAQYVNGQFVSNVIQQQFASGPQSRAPQVFTPDPSQVFAPSQFAQQSQQQQQQSQQQQQQQQLQMFLTQNSGSGSGSSSFAQPTSIGQQTLELGQQPLILSGQIQQPTQLNYGAQQSSIAQARPNPQSTSGVIRSTLNNPANVQFIDNTQLETHQLFKRQTATTDGEFGKKTTPLIKPSSAKAKVTSTTKARVASTTPKSTTLEDKKHTKRELYLSNPGIQFLDSREIGNTFDQTLLDDGLATVGQNQPILVQQQQQYDEREPAEAEVMAVMNLCSGCEEEPFQKALVFGWREVPKKLYSGAFYMPAVPKCRAF